MLNNPIISELLVHANNCKHVSRIQPDLTALANKKVTFHFEDYTNSVLQTTGDHKTFMRWWRDLVTFHRMMQKMKPPETLV